MIFAVSPGTEGSGPERYVASLPFVIAPGATLGTFDPPVSSTIGLLNLSVEKLHHIYTLNCGPFQTEAEASNAVSKLGIALLWFSLTHGVGVQYSKELGNATFFGAPLPIPESEHIMAHIGRVTGWTATDGHYEAEKAIVRPEHMRLARWESGRATITVGISNDNLLTCLHTALSFPRLEHIVNHAKLRLAIELYAAYRFELSRNAQLVSLVTALEALLPNVEIGNQSKAALAHGKKSVQAVRDAYPKNSSEWTEVNHLLSRIGGLQTESIGTTLRQFAVSAVSRHPKLGNPEEVSFQLRDAYSVRSKLLHEGHCPEEKLKEQLSFLCSFVPRFLSALFEEAAGI